MEREVVKNLLEEFKKLKIAVVGDLILDKYLFGKVERISPEAPVPVFEIEREEYRAGGGANVALNLKTLGVGEVYLLGRVGRDPEGEVLKKLLQKEGIKTFFLNSEGVPTTRKTRIVAKSQQLLRIDREKREPLEERETETLFGFLKEINPDAVIVSDYAKGVVTKYLGNLLRKKLDVPTFVDPRPQNFETYKGLFCITPNLKEFYDIAQRLGVFGSYLETAQRVRNDLELDTLVITLSEKGIALVREDIKHFPATAKEVYDVTGAGDTVIASLTASYLVSKSWETACQLANLCAGIAVSKLGTAPVYAEEVLKNL